MILVVGGGLSGLVVARTLQRRGYTVRVLESRERCGGRIRSVYDSKGRLAYESGPWRVAEAHTRARRLFAELKTALVPTSTPTPNDHHPVSETIPGLSTWDVNALSTGDPRKADLMDLQTGYADETHSASGSAPYLVDSTAYFVAPDGFDAMVDRLVETLEPGTVRYRCSVTDLRVEDDVAFVDVSERTGHNSFERTTTTCDALFVCVPPSQCMHWTAFAKHAKSVMHAVKPGELHHIYVRHSAFPAGVHKRDATSMLGQSISSQYSNAWFQASYTAGRIARFWYNLRLQSPESFREILRRTLRVMLRIRVHPTSEVRSHFWPVAYHAWRPVPDFDLGRSVRLAVRPNPAVMPNVYLAGEAFSSHQAWMEGALETAEIAVEAFTTKKRPAGRKGRSDRVYVDGRWVDVSRWALVHPGGQDVIRNHREEDVGALMAHIGHSADAWAVVHSLKRES